MTLLKEHIAFKLITLILVCTMLVPSFVKLAHAFEDHKHEVCEVPQKLHFHDFELDCEFYKFKINPQFTFNYSTEITQNTTEVSTKIISQYFFISDFQKLPFALRGPPRLV